MFKRVLILNRGEIALRAIHACHELDLVAILFVTKSESQNHIAKQADELYISEEESAQRSFLNVDEISMALVKSRAEALFPGYGFLSENSSLAELCMEQAVIFIGPDPHCLRELGDKSRAQALAQSAGVKILKLSEDPAEFGEYPILFKAKYGGGGRGHTVIYSKEDLIEKLPNLQARIKGLFGSSEYFFEKYIQAGQHLELQISGDGKGEILNLGSRDCSVQRHFQKVIEEGSAGRPETQALNVAFEKLAPLLSHLKYKGLGTLEFIWDQESGGLYFIEMNCRIQVEHPVTEMLIKENLVKRLLLIFLGQHLKPNSQPAMEHSIEVRLIAEDCLNHFLPSAGKLLYFNYTSSPNVRWDMSYSVGESVSECYDPLVGKIIAFGTNREEARLRLLQSLNSAIILGITTNLALLIKILNHTDFITRTHSIQWLENALPELRANLLAETKGLIDKLEKVEWSAEYQKESSSKGFVWKLSHRVP